MPALTTSAALQAAVLNVTLTRSPQAENLALINVMASLLSLLDFATALRWILRTLLNIVITSGAVGKWGEGLFSTTPLPRPPSLLSDVQAINSVTDSPVLNNAIIDVFEGQLICLIVVAAFILAFLIREWVINQQPLLNMPDAEQQDEPAPVRQEADAPVRRRRRGLRRPPDHNLQLENRPRAQPHIRRAATDNNILVHTQDGSDVARPAFPPRAASLVPALQEMEDSIRQIGNPHGLNDALSATDPAEQIESPPLQRGLFDQFGQIRRNIEEENVALAEEQSPTILSPAGITEQSDFTNFTFGTSSNNESDSGQAVSSAFTFRAGNQSTEPELLQEEPKPSVVVTEDEGDWTFDSDHERISTPQTSNTSQHVEVLNNEDVVVIEEDESGPAGTPDAGGIDAASGLVPVNEHHTLWAQLVDWLWHTDDFVADDPLIQHGTDAETAVDLNDHPPFRPVRDREGHDNVRNVPHAPLPPPPAQANPEPNVRDGLNVDDINAIDDAEDLEGVLELIGMEGPIAGMIQNIIFSVFLISLTLSAGIWCPYIWGKIALLFIAHPFIVFIQAPLYLVSRIADVIVDILLFVVGGAGLTLNNVAKLIKLIALPALPWIADLFDGRMLEEYSYSLSSRSGARLEKALAGTIFGLRPDLPTFSMQSHHVLRVLTRAIREISSTVTSNLLYQGTNLVQSLTWDGGFRLPLGMFAKSVLPTMASRFEESRKWFDKLQHDLRPLSFAKMSEVDYSLMSWSSSEKIVCVVLGYVLFSLAGYVYLRTAHYFLGLKKEEKVPGVLADTLRQSGGVLKVIIIIGIEMIVFPLYCGTMLDIALLPLFEGATIQSRFAFFIHAPITALFIHWFLGTCYMFHFALFVSMCRRIMRKGVLYFVRDPDDPTFHPVRDVLERPVATQLGKIAFSALVYGSLLVVCFGGVIQALNRLGNILPIHWSAREPVMKVPGDVVFYNFMLPFILRKIDLSDKATNLFEWWFRACAAGLRLTDFLFGMDSEQEKQPAVFLWRHFLTNLTLQDIADAPGIPSKATVKYFERLAKHPERLFWFETIQGKADEMAVRTVFGSDVKFKLIDIVDKEAQILIEFDKHADLKQVRKDIDREDERENTKIRIKQVRDLKIDVLFLRNSPVDRAAGMYVRAPAKDSVRIPKGTNVFLQVDENNKRVDDQDDPKTGLHGSKDDRFARLFVPTHFRARISAFIVLVWIFAAFLGLVFTIGPLLVGRVIIKSFTGITEPINDLYALTVGMHVFGGVIYFVYNITTRWKPALNRTHDLFTNTKQVFFNLVSAIQRVLSIAYLAVAVGVILPITLSVLTELYVHVPVYAYVLGNRDNPSTKQTQQPAQPIATSVNTPTIHLLQTWTLGLLYLRIAIRILTNTPHTNTRAATAIRAIVRNGYLHPDVRLASRALVLPVLTVCIFLLGLPLLVARAIVAIYPYQLTSEKRVVMYRYSYPTLLLAVVVVLIAYRLKSRIDSWHVKIRDEVYLIGERLHNFPGQEKDEKKSHKHRKHGSKSLVKPVKFREKGKENETNAEEPAGLDHEPTSWSWQPDDTAWGSEDDELREALRQSRLPLLISGGESANSRTNDDTRDTMADEIEQFKAITGLEGVANAEELGDVTRAVVEMQREDDRPVEDGASARQ